MCLEALRPHRIGKVPEVQDLLHVDQHAVTAEQGLPVQIIAETFPSAEIEFEFIMSPYANVVRHHLEPRAPERHGEHLGIAVVACLQHHVVVSADGTEILEPCHGTYFPVLEIKLAEGFLVRRFIPEMISHGKFVALRKFAQHRHPVIWDPTEYDQDFHLLALFSLQAGYGIEQGQI